MSESDGYAEMELDHPGQNLPQDNPLRKALHQFMDFLRPLGNGKYHLVPSQVRKWFAKCFQKAENHLPHTIRIKNREKITLLETEQNGPALTITIELSSGLHVDLDLAPVWPFHLSWIQDFNGISENISLVDRGPQWLKGRPRTYQKKVREGLNQGFFLVPISSDKQSPDWSIHLPMAEREIIHNMHCVKPVIRFVKVVLISIRV